MTESVPDKKGRTLFRFRRRFALPDGTPGEAIMRSTMSGLYSELWLDGAVVAEDFTPAMGEEAIRNHRLAADIAQGRLEVEAGYLSWWNAGIAVRLDGALIHESHPGRRIALPERAARMMRSASVDEESYDPQVWKRNRVPLGVDIGTGLLFFAIAKMTDLTTAALVGAVVGVALWAIQRRTKIDLLGGLAMFGIVMLLFSAALALVFQSDDAVKLRTTIVGLVTAALFLGDGLFGGKRLGARLAHYLPYTDIVPARLAFGIGVMGLVMAGLNLLVAWGTSTDVWLFYTTFGDMVVGFGLIMVVFSFARNKLWPSRRGGDEGPRGADVPA